MAAKKIPATITEMDYIAALIRKINNPLRVVQVWSKTSKTVKNRFLKVAKQGFVEFKAQNENDIL